MKTVLQTVGAICMLASLQGQCATLVVTTNCKANGCLAGQVTVLVNNSGFSHYLDAAGTAVLDSLPEGEATVFVVYSGNQRYPIDGQARVHLTDGAANAISITTFRRDTSASISGFVHDDQGKRVRPIGDWKIRVGAQCGFHMASVNTRADGSFLLPHVVPGPCRLTASHVDPHPPVRQVGQGITKVNEVIAPVRSVGVFIQPRKGTP